MKKKLFLAGLLTLELIGTVSALENTLPENCDYGRSRAYDFSISEVVDAVQDGLSVSESPYDADAWVDFANSLQELYNSFDYLRIEGPKHVIKGTDYTFKANLFDAFAYVHFFNSEDGLVGKDKSDEWANAHKTLNFNDTYGYGLAWTTRGDLCSAEGVWVQEEPTQISDLSHQYSGSRRNARVSGTLTMDAQIDQYSNYSLEGLPAKYEVQEFRISQWTGRRCEVVEESSEWTTVKHLSENNTFQFDYFSCDVQFRARAFDGTYYTNWDNYIVLGTGGRLGGGDL